MKKIVSLVLAFVMAFSFAPLVSAFADTGDENKDVVIYHEGMTFEEMTGKSILSIEYSDLNAIRNEAKDVVDAGTMIYITAPEASIEDVADLLSIPNDGTNKYSELVLMAYSIYKIGDEYVISDHYALFAIEGESEETPDDADMEELTAPVDLAEARAASNFSKVILMRDYQGQKSGNMPTIDPMDWVSDLVTIKADMDAMSANIVSD